LNIGVIGTGNVGSALGGAWAKKGHLVFFGSRNPEKGKKLAASVGSNARGGTIVEASRFGEAVLLAVNYNFVSEAIREAGSLEGKVLIDCTNPLTIDRGLSVGYSTSAAEEIATLVNGAHVVKAFNAVFARVMATAEEYEPAPTAFVCGDDEDAKRVVSRLAADIGFEPVDCGRLKNARFLEPAAVLIIQLAYSLGMGNDIAFRILRGQVPCGG